MSTCQNSTSYLSTTTRIPISTVTPLSGSGTVSSTSNASSSLNDDDVDDVTAERYPYTRELLSDDPYGTAEDANDRLDLLEEAVDSNYSKYIAEGSVRNVSAFALNVLTQMTEIKGEHYILCAWLYLSSYELHLFATHMYTYKRGTERLCSTKTSMKRVY